LTIDTRAKELVRIGDSLFSKLQPWNDLRQEICELCHPLRADYNTTLSPGEDFQGNLMDSFMVQTRETLGNMPLAVLRQGDWFNLSTGEKDIDENPQNMSWFDGAKAKMRKGIYSPRANFVNACIEADHDWVSVGNPVLSVEENKDRNGLLYKAWHPRDVVWMMDADGQIDHVQRTMMMSARNIEKKWPKTCPQGIKTACQKDPNKQFKIRHILMTVEDLYGDDKAMRRKFGRNPYVSLYVAVEHNTILGQSGTPVFNYIVPRWRSLSNISIGFSPATINSLADGRMLQEMARIVLEQGEKAVDPPTIGSGDVFKNDINLYAGGFTMVDLDGQKLQDVMQVVNETGNVSFGVEMRQDIRNMIAEAFLINKLMLPNAREMTAFETQVRLDEYRRAALPFFGPIESEYHLKVLNVTFDLMLANKAFEPPPDELRDRDLTFQFEGPLNTLEGRQTVAAFQESVQIIAAGVSATQDQTIVQGFDIKQATKDAVRGAGGKPDWFVSEDAQKEIDAQNAQQANLAQAAAIANAGATTAKNIGEGAQALQAAGLSQAGV
jgi:hypothetical protein